MTTWYLGSDRPSINLEVGESKFDWYHQWDKGPLSNLEMRIVLLLEEQSHYPASAMSVKDIEATLGIPCLYALKSLQGKGFVGEFLTSTELNRLKRLKPKATPFDEAAKEASKPK